MEKDKELTLNDYLIYFKEGSTFILENIDKIKCHKEYKKAVKDVVETILENIYNQETIKRTIKLKIHEEREKHGNRKII